MVRPEEILNEEQNYTTAKDGSLVRKGSVAALIASANKADVLLIKPQTVDVQSALKTLAGDIRSLIPSLHSLGFFDIFPANDWFKTDSALKLGKAYVGILYLQHFPHLVTAETESLLKTMQEKAPAPLKLEIQTLLKMKP